jgi:hypothetical protein
MIKETKTENAFYTHREDGGLLVSILLLHHLNYTTVLLVIVSVNLNEK